MLPWIIVCIVMLIWGNGAFKAWANSIFVWNYPVPELHNMINKVPPVAAETDAGKPPCSDSPICPSPDREC